MRPSGVRGQDALAPSGRLGRVSGRERTSLIRDFVWSSHPAQGRRVVGRAGTWPRFLGKSAGRALLGRRHLAVPRAARRGPCCTCLSTRPARLSARGRARRPPPKGPDFELNHERFKVLPDLFHASCPARRGRRVVGAQGTWHPPSRFLGARPSEGGRLALPRAARRGLSCTCLSTRPARLSARGRARRPPPKGARFRAESPTLQSVAGFVPCESTGDDMGRR